MNHLIKAAKDNKYRNTLNIIFGMNIPHYHKEAMMFDANNENINWKDSEIPELKQIYNFDPFGYLGLVNRARITYGYTNKQVHIIYNYKQYGRYKAHMVASGNMIGPNIHTNSSSVISLHSMRICVFLSELNNIETRTGDISNSYLTARTTDNIVFNVGP